MNALFEYRRGRANLLAPFLLILLCTGLSLLAPRTSAATFLEQELTPDDATGDDAFGYGAAVDGATAMIGEAHGDVNGNHEQGRVYVYARSGRRWVQTQKLVADDGTSNQEFGWSIVLQGDTAAIGARSANQSRGAVYIFTRSDGVWTQLQKLTASDGKILDWFGYDIAVSGTRMVVGARNARGGRGAAYFYDGSSGTWVLTAELSPSDLQSQDYFGNSVAISGTTAIVGAFNINDTKTGKAYVFDDIGGTWVQTQTLFPSDDDRGAWFGFSVSLDGNTAAIGANQTTINGKLDQGAVYVFSKAGGGPWVETQRLLASDGAEFGGFGWDVVVKGNIIFTSSTAMQAVYFFGQSQGIWSERVELMPTVEGVDAYGWTAAFDGRTALVTAPFTVINGTTQGAAFSYTRRR